MIYNKYKINITLNKFLENGYYLYPSVYTYWYLLCSALSEWPLFVKKSQPQTGHLPLLTLFPLHCKKREYSSFANRKFLSSISMPTL